MLSAFLCADIGKILFSDTFLTAATAAVCLPLSCIMLKVRARRYVRNQDKLLENTMNLITNSYLSCNDIIKAVNENLDKLDIPGSFEEFVTDVTLVDSYVCRALRKLEMKMHNRYFSEWIDILVIAQEKSGDYRFVLPAILQSMNDTKRLKIKADTVMMSNMSTLAKDMMQRELAKRPGRVRVLVIPIVLVAVTALFYVIGMNLFDSIGSIM